MKSQAPIIAPSILAADYLRMGEDIASISSADWIHCDIMDGNFVPNVSFGPDMVKALVRASDLPVDCHLMIQNPDNWVETYANAGASSVTFHLEATPHAHRLCYRLRELGVKAGVAINPSTPIEALTDLLDYLDLVLVMTVNPGFGGQHLIERSYSKLQRLTAICDERGVSPLIEVDGGVGKSNAYSLAKAGADVLVCGSSLFKTSDRVGEITTLRNEGLRGIEARD